MIEQSDREEILGKLNRGRTKVLRIIARMNVGGPAIQVCTLAQGLPANEFEQTLLTGTCEPGEIDYLEFNEISLPLIRVSSLGRKVNFTADLKAFLFLRRQLMDLNPDIIHTHTFKAGVLGRLASLTVHSQAKMIHTFHGHLLEGYLDGLRLWILVQMEKLLAKKTDVLVSVGEKVKEDLLDRGIGKIGQYRVIPPGFPIDVSIEEQAMPRTQKARTNEFKCAWVGRMVEIKRPDRVLEIARLLKSRESGIRIFMIGDGPLRRNLEEISKRELLPVAFLGWQSDIHRILSKMDSLILTSRNEGTPISIIEAQRLGKPVISTNVGSVTEVMRQGESGFAVEYSPLLFVEKLELLRSQDDLYLRLSKNAKEFAHERFSPRNLVENYANLYRAITKLTS